jgi:chromosomal replication initiation ATPase DnaA
MRDWILISPADGLSGKALMRFYVDQAAQDHGVFPAEIMGPSRLAKVAAARLDAYARIYATGRFSYPQIGRFFNRDHSTVVHGVKVFRARSLAERDAA